MGLNRVRVTQILNLLRLAPEIQQHILTMPSTTAKRAAVTENRLRGLVGIRDQELQVQKFGGLVKLPCKENAGITAEIKRG